MEREFLSLILRAGATRRAGPSEFCLQNSEGSFFFFSRKKEK
jgi:hypothetical protein